RSPCSRAWSRRPGCAKSPRRRDQRGSRRADGPSILRCMHKMQIMQRIVRENEFVHFMHFLHAKLPLPCPLDQCWVSPNFSTQVSTYGTATTTKGSSDVH